MHLFILYLGSSWYDITRHSYCMHWNTVESPKFSKQNGTSAWHSMTSCGDTKLRLEIDCSIAVVFHLS